MKKKFKVIWGVSIGLLILGSILVMGILLNLPLYREKFSDPETFEIWYFYIGTFGWGVWFQAVSLVLIPGFVLWTIYRRIQTGKWKITSDKTALGVLICAIFCLYSGSSMASKQVEPDLTLYFGGEAAIKIMTFEQCEKKTLEVFYDGRNPDFNIRRYNRYEITTAVGNTYYNFASCLGAKKGGTYKVKYLPFTKYIISAEPYEEEQEEVK